MPSQFYIAPFNGSVPYRKFDTVYGISNADGTFASAYFYATQDTPASPISGAYGPSGLFVYSATQYSRSDDVTTVTFSQTGVVPNVQAGSIIRVAGISANTSVEYTGMAIGGGSGWASYINPGWPQTQSLVTGTVSMLNPMWTTGFFFAPSYSSKMGSNNMVITAKLGDGYEQREPAGLNTYDKTWQMVFQSRSDRETKAIINFVQDAGGVRPFPILVPVSMLENQPNAKYVAPSVDYTTESFGLNTATVVIRRVFDL